MEHLRKVGRPRLGEVTEHVGIKMPSEMVRRVLEVASGKTRSAALREAIEAGVTVLEQSKKK